jgi:hypothetical protein
MTSNLGDRIRAKRQARWDLADAARDAAKAHAVTLRDALKTYVDNQITAAKAVSKTYVDNRIAKLAADNNLTNNP